MSLGYLISPAFQYENESGKPLVGGTIRVCHHGTTSPYITYADFHGNRNPEYVPLDAKGMAILLASDENVYDVYCYDRNGVEQWSRLNVAVGGGGGGGGGGEYYAGEGIVIEDGVISVDVDEVQSDWNETDDSLPSFINNKPDLATVATTGSYNDLSDRPAIPSGDQLVPTATAADEDKVLTVDSTGTPVWAPGGGGGGGVTDVEVDGTSVVNAQGVAEITMPSIPQTKPVVAGTGITITENTNDITLAATAQVPSYAFADRNKVLKVVYDGSSTTLAWGQPSGYTSWETDWASGYSHSHTVTADDVTAGYFDLFQAYAAGADTSSMITSPIRVNLVWDTWCTSGATSNYVSSVDFAIGTDGGSYRDMFTDNAPAHEVHKDWFIYPNYLLHTRCNRIRIRYHLTANATAGVQFSNEVSGLVDQVR